MIAQHNVSFPLQSYELSFFSRKVAFVDAQFGKQIWTCWSQLQLHDRFSVKECSNFAETIKFLRQRTEYYTNKFEVCHLFPFFLLYPRADGLLPPSTPLSTSFPNTSSKDRPTSPSKNTSNQPNRNDRSSRPTVRSKVSTKSAPISRTARFGLR